ncbi:HEPN domain-containing protein [uncultured Psychrobacter sp.]|uniref:ApeA N-terminal domain 1-containing protein n=1 Tax=uncultured Psychrobacter sp. TaxID=259303 RepID=UPI00345A7CBD
MNKYFNEKTVGQFIIDNKTYFGEMELKETDSTLIIYLDEFIPQASQMRYPTQMHGTLYDLTKVTLIDMLFLGGGGNNKQNSDGSYERSQYLKFDLHYVVFGDDFIDENRSVFKSIDFSVSDSNILFGFDSFKHIIDASKDKVRELIENNSRRTQLKYGFSNDIDELKFGENPEIYIYTGAYILENFLIPYGRLTVRNNINTTHSWNKGFNIKNPISSSIDFEEPTDFWDSLKSVNPIVKLYELILGKRQVLNTYKLEVETESHIPTIYQVYQVNQKKVLQTNYSHPSDRLIHVESETDEFESLLNKWLLRQEEWKFARSEFFEVFTRKYYSSDLLIKVANLFDIIPDSAYEKSEEISDELLQAKEKCKDIFKDLPSSNDKNSILGALGRIGKKSLRGKIRDRYSIIENSGFATLDEIDIVIGNAVNCRNFFVHGSPGKFDYIENFSQISFFINTLSFIYGTSELIELGWNFKNWEPDELNFHPFSSYLISYSSKLDELKNVLFSAKESKGGEQT